MKNILVLGQYEDKFAKGLAAQLQKDNFAVALSEGLDGLQLSSYDRFLVCDSVIGSEGVLELLTQLPDKAPKAVISDRVHGLSAEDSHDIYRQGASVYSQTLFQYRGLRAELRS